VTLIGSDVAGPSKKKLPTLPVPLPQKIDPVGRLVPQRKGPRASSQPSKLLADRTGRSMARAAQA